MQSFLQEENKQPFAKNGSQPDQPLVHASPTVHRKDISGPSLKSAVDWQTARTIIAKT